MANNPNMLHHVAYRCTNAAETVEFYTKLLDMKLAHALFNDKVPSTGQWSPHLHVFFEMKDGSYVAFFEVPCEPPAIPDPNTPKWVQHLALEVDDEETLLKAKKKLEDGGVNVVGVTDHGFCHSIYFFDPSGHRLELTIRTDSDEEREKFAQEAPEVMKVWQKRHESGEFSKVNA
jgi:glyoxylase I family protein